MTGKLQSKHFISVREYSSSHFVLDDVEKFTEDEVRITETEFRDKIDIIPRFKGRFEIKTQQFVGYIVLPNHVISIVPKIPGASFFNMIRYSLHLPVITPEDFELSEGDSYYDILVHFFLDELERILQRGLYKGYRNYDESLTCLRGKILFKEHVSINHNRKDKIFCSYSELSSDITENQVIKYTLHYLSQCYFPNEEMNARLLRYYRRLDEVEVVRISVEALGSIEFSPLNEHYRTILSLCNLFLRDTSLDQEGIGERTAKSFLIDMNRLFESFVSTLLSERLEGYNVETQITMYSEVTGNPTKLILDLLISRNGKPILIMDTKYHEYHGSPENSHIYQLYYYCSNTHIKNGCLIYPGLGTYNHIPQEQNILLHIILLDLNASNQFEFEDKCSSFIRSMSDILSLIHDTASDQPES